MSDIELQWFTQNEVRRAKRRKLYVEHVEELRRLTKQYGVSLRELSRKMGYSNDTALSSMMAPSAVKSRRLNHTAIQQAIDLIHELANENES